jgi:DNA invertase Pin-like site-specific DNA recombinase
MRVSKADGSQTVKNQALDLRAYAQRMGYEIIEFTDTETGSRNDRDGLKALLAACSRKEVSTVLIWKLDRVTRMGAREALNFFHSLDCWGVGYKSITEAWLDSEGPVPMLRDILISVVGSFAKNERENLIVRTKAGIARARSEGKVLGRPAVIGSKGHVGDLQKIATMHKAGMSQRKIAAALKLSKGTVQRAIEGL